MSTIRSIRVPVGELQPSRYRKFRLLAIESGGGCCQRCRFSDERALQVDHVWGDGHVDSYPVPRSYAQLRTFRERLWRGELQLLCANCNQIKRVERSEHLRTNPWRSRDVAIR